MIKIILIFIKTLVFLIMTNTLSARPSNIRVSDPLSRNPEEVTIAINPNNPLNLVAGANISYYYYSYDGGKSWTEGNLTSSYGVWGDPCVVFDGEGNAYFGHLSRPTFGYWLDRIVVQKSTDGGKSWNDGAGVGYNPFKQQDKEWLAVDLTDSPYRNNLYMAWTEFDEYGSTNPNDSSRIIFSRSTDAGESWSTPIIISDVSGDCRDDDDTVEGAVPAIGPDGTVYLSWSSPLGIMFDKSTDGGETFGKDVLVTSQPGGWAFDVSGIFRCNGFPVTACDVSDSPYRGHIYILWSDQRNGTINTDVFLIKSTDGGESWGDIKKVNDDNTSRHQFFPWLTIDQSTGYIYIVFYDRRNTKGDVTDVYVAKSTDGGETFINFKVSQIAFTPNENIFFGDYTNIAAHNGMVYPIWMRMDGTDLSIWTAIVADTAFGTDIEKRNEFVYDFILFQNYPNPFNATTNISFSLKKASHIKIVVYDVLGKIVCQLIDEHYTAGKYKVQWDGTDSANMPAATGIYFYRMSTNEGEVKKKMILLQ